MDWWDNEFDGKIIISGTIYNLYRRCPGCKRLCQDINSENNRTWCTISRAIAAANEDNIPIKVVK